MLLRTLLLLLAAAAAWAQAEPPLQRSLRSATLDPQRVYRVRDAAMDLEDVHITFIEGTIAFSESVDGRITAAFFEGEGDILLVPPDSIERTSLGLHTGSAVLEERFTTAYLRFSDDLYSRLTPAFRPFDGARDFVARWGPVARSLADAEADAAALLAALNREPAGSGRYFRGRFGGSRLGTFDVRLDTRLPEQVWLGQSNYRDGVLYVDTWAAFPMRSVRRASGNLPPRPANSDHYRDLWLPQALTAYTGLMRLEAERPNDFRKALQALRDRLLEKAPSGILQADAGPVTLGPRLRSSKAPGAYEAVIQGRGPWLLHMLRHLLRDPGRPAAGDVLFHQALRSLDQRSPGAPLSTSDLQAAFERVLPPHAYFDGRKALDWFFEEWVNGSAVPQLELAGVVIARRGQRLLATGRILQKHAPRTLVTPVPLYAQVDGRQVFLGRVFADGEETSFRLPVPAGTRGLLLDPQQTVLRRE